MSLFSCVTRGPAVLTVTSSALYSRSSLDLTLIYAFISCSGLRVEVGECSFDMVWMMMEKIEIIQVQAKFR